MDFKRYLAGIAQMLDQQIEQILTNFLHEVEKINPKLTPFALGLISSCKGGKRVRGILVKLGFEIASGRSLDPRNDEIIKVGAAYEILHAAILIHDDIIDQSELRRGKLTLYKALGGNHYGISQALMLGDIGLFLPIKLIADSSFLGEYKNMALSFFAQTVINTGWGEVLDVELSVRGKGKGEREKSREEADVIAIHSLKTAQYTISGPLILGAILGGGDKGLLGELGKYGEKLGIAFQIQDDILGVFGDEEELGKSVSSDIEEGKNTLLITEALKRASPRQKRILDRYYGKPFDFAQGKGDKGLEEVRKVFLETGSLDYSRQLAVQYVTQAKKIIPQITKDSNMRKLLEQMADYLVERRK